MALWPYINKFGKWPVGAHVIRFATGVDKHKPVCYHAGTSSMAYRTMDSAVLVLKWPRMPIEYLALLQVPFI